MVCVARGVDGRLMRRIRDDGRRSIDDAFPMAGSGGVAFRVMDGLKFGTSSRKSQVYRR